jgi:hypothetical protein
MDLAVRFSAGAVFYIGALSKNVDGQRRVCAVPTISPAVKVMVGTLRFAHPTALPMTFDELRKFALRWPEVEDGTSYGTPALKVRKKMLVRLKEDGDSLVMPGVPRDEREMLVESQPKLFYFTDHYRDYPMVLIRLSKASRATVEPLLRRHWRTLASKKAVKEFDTTL